MEWILVIWMLHSGNYNYNPTVIDGFKDKSECVRAGEESTNIGLMRKSDVRFRCISRSKK